MSQRICPGFLASLGAMGQWFGWDRLGLLVSVKFGTLVAAVSIHMSFEECEAVLYCLPGEPFT